jgi:hypothetical protein
VYALYTLYALCYRTQPGVSKGHQP